MLINPTKKLLIPTSVYTKRIIFNSSHTEFEDDPEDIFGLGGCKRDKRFYARCYRLLELDNDSSQDLVRSQYIKLAKIHHPDSGQAASLKRFQRIDQAYRELMKKFNEEKRQEEKTVGEYGLYYEDKDEQDKTSSTNLDFDIQHTAPQHRQYLSNEGFGFGNPFQRQKQYQKFRAIKATESVIDHTVDKLSAKYETQLAVQDGKNAKKAKKHTTKNAMERLVEDLIAESMAKGDFDNLSGAGKPLPERVIYNPYEDFTTHKMNQILVDGGFAPEWIMLKKDIDKLIETLDEDLIKHCFTFLKKSSIKDYEFCWQKWKSQCECEFQDEIQRINGYIDKYNLVVPMLQSQKFHIGLDKRMGRTWKEVWPKFEKSKVTAAQKVETIKEPKTFSILDKISEFVTNRIKL